MGSAKYPDENEYDSFISQMGGSSNAFTECEYTLYHFDVLPKHFEKVMHNTVPCYTRDNTAALINTICAYLIRGLFHSPVNVVFCAQPRERVVF